MIIVTLLIETILVALIVLLYTYSIKYFKTLPSIIATILVFVLFVFPITYGLLHGYINYNESNDRNKVKIISVTLEQTGCNTYYIIDVKYIVNNDNKDDIFYCYYTDSELVNTLKDNVNKELYIISGYKGGYETYRDFGVKLIKDIELIEKEEI